MELFEPLALRTLPCTCHDALEETLKEHDTVTLCAVLEVCISVLQPKVIFVFAAVHEAATGGIWP